MLHPPTLWSSLSDKAPSLCLATYFPNSLKKATFYFSCNRKYMRFSKEASARTNTPPRAGSSPPADSTHPPAASHLAGPPLSRTPNRPKPNLSFLRLSSLSARSGGRRRRRPPERVRLLEGGGKARPPRTQRTAAGPR